MEILSNLKPLYDNLIKQGFGNYMSEPSFNRTCNKLEISGIWALARNATNKRQADDMFSFIINDNSNTLAGFLTRLYEEDEQRFFNCIAALIIDFVSVWKQYLEVNDILEDLNSINLPLHHREQIQNAYSIYEKNIEIKVNNIYNIMLSRAIEGGGDETIYQKLRQQLLRSSVKQYLPSFTTEFKNLSDFRPFMQQQGGYKDRRAFLKNEFAPLFKVLEKQEAFEVQAGFDEVHLKERLSKAFDRINNDPDGAITAARSLLESVLKHILHMKLVEIDNDWDLGKLYKNAARALNMAPDQHTQTSIQTLLRGAVNIVEGIAGLRNRLGDAHGAAPNQARPSPRHAELAVNMASALSHFMIRSLKEVNSQQNVINSSSERRK